MAIVTKQSLQALLANPDRRIEVIGRALVALFEYQTKEEKRINHTNEANNVGFSGADGKAGTLTAKYYLKHGTLYDWQVARWMKPAKDGYPRLCKYVKQLNHIAELKAQRKTDHLL